MNYFESNNKNDCNGCGICALKCPKQAIKMIEDEEGFIYPKIDKSKCIDCGLCKRICSNNPINNNFNIKCYAAKNKDLIQRKNSTSGGMFKVLAEYVLEKNGYVAGVRYDNHLNVVHDISNDSDIVKCFSYSKYVRSDIKDIYVRIEKLLKRGFLVLFTGTPCQNYALKKYLMKDYDNLILCEIMCHSNPSPLVFKKFIKNIEIINNAKVDNFSFRNKDYNRPYAEISNNKIIYGEYNNAFNSMLISRPSCSNCRFCDSNRKSDLTIGDFWGIDKYDKDFNDGIGVSLLIISSSKGEKVFNSIKDKIDYKEHTVGEAFKYNHNKNIAMNKHRNIFFKKIRTNKINENNIIRYLDKYSKEKTINKIINKLFSKK